MQSEIIRRVGKAAFVLGTLLWGLSGAIAAEATSRDDAKADKSSSKGATPANSTSAKKKAHPPTTAFDRAVDPTVIPTPPPTPVNEQMSRSPGDNYVWVPGHYVPIQRKWTWVPGKWSVPPDAGAVWIPGRYDGPTQRWTAGYWQPGEPYPANESSEPEPAATNAAKR